MSGIKSTSPGKVKFFPSFMRLCIYFPQYIISLLINLPWKKCIFGQNLLCDGRVMSKDEIALFMHH